MPVTDLDPGHVENLSQRLLGHGVRPTAQRLRIAGGVPGQNFDDLILLLLSSAMLKRFA